MNVLRKYMCCSILKVLLFHYMKHSNHVDGKRGMAMVARKMVRQLYEDGIRKLNAIIAAFQNRSLKNLNLKMFWQNLDKKHLNHQLTVSVKDVFNCCNDRMNVPVEEDEPFVFSLVKLY
ncbi:hypothetical protein AVEN_266921-1 [Araneus ventricosus]|uniref:Uncharacterized protein n=1 Tax=Araneus ventricosus TaxID=182803 RepID=A0A4Y2DE10_ARAVE|nr:hypothetical protein AVEN_266921-1 [Araneus ventricosus]